MLAYSTSSIVHTWDTVTDSKALSTLQTRWKKLGNCCRIRRQSTRPKSATKWRQNVAVFGDYSRQCGQGLRSSPAVRAVTQDYFLGPNFPLHCFYRLEISVEHRDRRLRCFESNRVEIRQECSWSKYASCSDWRIRVFHLTSQFQDDGHDVISRNNKVLPPGELTRSVCSSLCSRVCQFLI